MTTFAAVATPGRGDLVEARRLQSALAATEHMLRGERSHLFQLEAGGGFLLTGEEEIALRGPCFNWIPRGQSARLRLDAGTRGMALSIPDAHLGRAIPTDPIAGDLRETIGFPLINRPLDPDRGARIIDLIDSIRVELFDNGPAAGTVVQHSLTLLLIEIWRGFRPRLTGPKPLPRRIVHTFFFLVDLHLHDHWRVQDYAHHIGVSKDRLNSAVRRATGRAPLAHIHARIMTEAKTLLSESGLQVAEVAYKLGYRDAAYFNRFFQRQAGMPPGRFRTQALRDRPDHDLSYAAWP